MNTDIAPLQFGYVDEEILEIVDLIHQFTTSADFADWITNQTFNHVVLDHKIADGKYTRLFQYDLNGQIFFNGKIEIETKTLSKGTIQNLNDKVPILTRNSFFSDVCKTNLSRVIADPFYTIISKCSQRSNCIGMTWEIYNLVQLVKIYKSKRDPLRYWRRTRRE